MAIIKCKMCGGDLNIIEGASTAECEFCGSVQTVPKVDDEKKLTLFARANRLRAACEFDKAAGIYEAIVADFQEEAEAYWGLVLCKYGIEYVDDPATGKKIPTCHRSSFDSIMDDSDLEQALENADPAARKVYREEAKAIEEIRKGIIAVSANEEPYDIFICYKETAEDGDRTLDSVLAQDVYDALTDKGYRVFFSRITLEDKLGQEYEPYIFAALNSAKIMLAFGTDYEYFNAVWVKNEWSRFLKLMAKDKEKHLIPCFKGIDAYDMPKEFARLQAQDLGKVGAIQDLLRGIEKIIPRQTAQPVVVQERVVVGGSGDNKIASLLDRGNMALEDGDWAKADSFFEDVLNNDSKNAQAYLGKTLATEKCRTIDAFARKRKDASQNVRGETLKLPPNQAHVDEIVERFSLPGYVEQNAIRKLYDFDLSYHSDVAERKQQYRNEETYWANHKQLSRAEKFAVGAVAENLQREKKALFAALTDRVKQAENAEAAAKSDVQARYEAHQQQADARAEELYNQGLARRERDYQSFLLTAKTSFNIKELTETAKEFDLLGDYQDSKNLAAHCRNRAVEEQAKLDAEKECQRRIREQQEKARKAKRTRLYILASIAAAVAIAAIVVMVTVVVPANSYDKAKTLMEEGKYAEAVEVFTKLGNYKDAPLLKAEALRPLLHDNTLSACNQAVAAKKADGIWIDTQGKMPDEANIVAVSGGGSLWLYNDGTVGVASSYYSDSISQWQDIVAISANNHYVGLRYDGTVVAVGPNKYGQCDVSDWTDIVAISAGSLRTVGLKADGTVVATGYDTYSLKLDKWRNIIAIADGNSHTVGLRSDGTVVANHTGIDEELCRVSDWTDIVAICAGVSHTVGLRADGTVVAIGKYNEGQCNVSDWTDIVAIAAGDWCTVGLKADGTILVAGEANETWDLVESWTGIHQEQRVTE